MLLAGCCASGCKKKGLVYQGCKLQPNTLPGLPLWLMTGMAAVSLSSTYLRPELLPVDRALTLFSRFLDAADLLLPTASEAHALAGIAEDDQAAQVLLRGRDRILVYKRGAGGCTVYAAGERWDVPGFTVLEVDPTGAGDCFNAAFLVGLVENWNLEQTGRFACAAGALAVTRQGPMEGAPSRKEVEDFLK
jgi:sugar/nucleoside kinase (ribokinase family)